MSAVIVVFVIWFAIVVLLGTLAAAMAGQFRLPEWCRRVRGGFAPTADAAVASIGRGRTAVITWLAGWSVVIIVGWLMGLWAHRLQGLVDEPTFRWWDSHHLDGQWSRTWLKLTNIGSPTLTQQICAVGAVVLAVLYFGRRFWWAPSVTVLLGYVAEKYSQIILKAVVHRGHPPTSLGTWPSGGMGRLIDIYGLIIYFVIRRFWPQVPRAWAAAGLLLALLASVQAYARINNLEHWLTDVVGGAVYGFMLLSIMIIGHAALTREPTPESLAEERELPGTSVARHPASLDPSC